jgi:hypothetical protein
MNEEEMKVLIAYLKRTKEGLEKLRLNLLLEGKDAMLIDSALEYLNKLLAECDTDT